MKPEWAEQRSDSHMITLLDDSFEDVSLYVLWLYSREIRVTKAEGGSYNVKDTSDLGLLAEVLVKAYIYGQKVMDGGYQRAVIKEVFLLQYDHDWVPEPDVLCLVYDATPKGCSARQLTEDLVGPQIHTGDHTDAYWEEKLQSYPRQLLIDLVKYWAGSYPYGTMWECDGVDKYLAWLANF